MIETTKEIIGVMGAAVGVLATGIPFLIGLIRKTKQLIKERNRSKIAELLPTLIREAERFVNYSGVEKKEYVKSRLAVYSAENNIPFDGQKFGSAIDDTVKLTKEVNRREKDEISVSTGVLPLTSAN